VRSALVVVVEPVWQGLGAGVMVGVGDAVGPFAAHGLVEALDFAVDLGASGWDQQMADAVLGEESAQGAVLGIRPGVVGHDPAGVDAEAGVPGQRSHDKAGDGVGALVGVQLGVGDAGVVIDDGVDVLVSPAGVSLSAGAGADSGDGVSRSQEPCVALGVDVQQVTGARPLIAAC